MFLVIKAPKGTVLEVPDSSLLRKEKEGSKEFRE